jgi:hypothetical protein
MTLHPKAAKDLSLAPVAAAVDINLQRIRDHSPDEIERTIQLETNSAPLKNDREERSERVLEQALRNVDLHGWDAAVTQDGSAVRLSGGSVSLDLSLSAAVARFIEDPVAG